MAKWESVATRRASILHHDAMETIGGSDSTSHLRIASDILVMYAIKKMPSLYMHCAAHTI